MANEKRLDLIDRWALAARYVDLDYNTVGTPWTLRDVLNFLECSPTVEAVEVVHGYWIDSYNADHMGRIIEHSIDCSVCDSVFKDDSREVVKRWKERFKVCPFCGAKMDGGNEDGN